MQTHKPMRVGVVGLGHQSIEDHIPAVFASKDTVLVGVADVDSSKLKEFELSHKGIPTFDDVDKMIDKMAPEIVIVAIPHHSHFEVVKHILEKKVNVLKEKPFAVSLNDAKELVELAKRNNVKMMVTAQRRYNPIYSTFLQLVDKIGDPFYIESKYTIFTDSPNAGWRGESKLAGGGCIIDMGYHMIDLLVWYFGLPDKIYAEMSSAAKENIAYDAEDTAAIIFRYNNKDVWGSLLLSRVIPPKQEYFNVYGTRGYLHIERGKIERFSIEGKMCESLSRENSWPSAFQDQIEYFVKVVKGLKIADDFCENHFNHLAFIEAAYRSKEQGMPVNPREVLIERKLINNI